MKPTKPLPTLPALGGSIFAIGLGFTSMASAAVVTNFSNFSESGNLLTGSNDRQQTFTPTGGSVTVTTATSENNNIAGQETYMSDEFPTLTTGYRITLDLTSANFANSSDVIALAVASTETPGTRNNLLVWGWRTTTMYATVFDGGTGNRFQQLAYPGGERPDSVFIERTATGWNLGSIEGVTETLFFTNISTFDSNPPTSTINITADGTAFGLWSDMRNNASTWTVNNLTVVPEPSTALLGGLGALLLLRRRRN